jgi:ABC-type lipoprotein export system ATPase subunit
MNDLRGSNWRIWDLHIHTPDSIVQRYGGRSNETWDRFLNDLESLPQSIRVIGINDYIFLDGYRRIIEEKKKGRLPNIDLILPVIELRLDKFGGSDSKLSRVNFHVIFSSEIDADVIEQQFLNTLTRSYRLSPEHKGSSIEWRGVLTKASLQDLGNKIIATVPEKDRSRFGNAFIEGFNNLNIDLDNILDSLDKPYFKGKYLTAVGKTEWCDIKWNDKSIAEKKNIINLANFVFIASENINDYKKSKESLCKEKVNDMLLDCSDAHYFSDSKEKDRLGNCLTWLKADPTFYGLKHVLVEPEERVFIGETPPQLDVVNNNKTKFIKSVSIQRIPSGKLPEKWFDSNLMLNHGLVAIIGNKGSGKSALVDIIGLLGNSKNQRAFSFLNQDKFRKLPENKAKSFEAQLSWESNDVVIKKLDEDVDPGEVERVKYIPQNYFEEICTQLGGVEETAFDKELKSVIYSHVSEAERLGKTNLDELILYKSGEVGEALQRARNRLEKVNGEIVEFEKMLTRDYKENLESQLRTKQAEYDAVKRMKPVLVKKPLKQSTSGTTALKKTEGQKRKLEDELNRSSARHKDIVALTAKLAKLSRKIDNIEDEIATFRDEATKTLEGIELNIDSIVKVEFDRKPLETLQEALLKEMNELKKILDEKNKDGLKVKIKSLKQEIELLRDQLDQPNKAYQKYLDDKVEWDRKINDVMGNEKKQGSICNLRWQIEELGKIPARLSQSYERRRTQAHSIYRLIKKQKGIYAELYAPVQKFIDEHPDIRQKIDLIFGVSIQNLGFEENFFNWINQSKLSAFMGIMEGKRRLLEVIAQHDFDDEDNAVSFAEEITKMIQDSRRTDDGFSPRINEQLKTGKTVESLYNFIYSFMYLQARYILKLGEKELRQLSPGERGALLIVFYLLVDLDTIPLVIDQPEHNLDNETVTKLLVPAIKKAKIRRQIIIVTHNPILAVVCNADQVIAASLDIKGDYQVDYSPGAIENPAINAKIVDILEGTMLAFDNRNRKYIREYLEMYKNS